VLGHENPVAFLELLDAEPTGLFGGLSFEVGDLGFRAVPDIQPGLAGSVAPVGLLEVHEEAVVQAPDLLEGGLGDQETGAHHVFDPARGFMPFGDEDDALGQGSPQPEPPRIQESEPVVTGAGEIPACNRGPAVPVDQARAHRADLIPAVHEPEQADQ